MHPTPFEHGRNGLMNWQYFYQKRIRKPTQNSPIFEETKDKKIITQRG
jgi:hypothetical protein